MQATLAEQQAALSNIDAERRVKEEEIKSLKTKVVEQTRMKQYAEDLFLAQKLDEKINRDFATIELDEHPAKLTLLAQELLDLKKLNELSDELIHRDNLTGALDTYMYGHRLLAVLLDLNCYISTTMRKTLLDGLMMSQI
ncbi:MAG: hypothetical protein ABSF60_09520 [Verrucomicrobiota bacterium]